MKNKYKIYLPCMCRSTKEYWKLDLIRDLLNAGYIVYRLKNYTWRLGRGTYYMGTTFYLKRVKDYEK